MNFRSAFIAVAMTAVAASAASADPILSENFDSLPVALTAGWTIVNNSAPVGLTDWFQGNSGVFGAQGGAPSSYLGANFNNAGGAGDISDWLLTPTLSLQDGDVLSFYTRQDAAGYADRLQVRLSTSGSSTDVGGTASSVGDFTDLLLDINPTLSADGYPGDWTQYNITLSGLGAVSGRFAFRYDVADSGPLGNNGNYIGLDTVSVSEPVTTSVPEPFTLSLFGAGLAGAAAMRRRRKKA